MRGLLFLQSAGWVVEANLLAGGILNIAKLKIAVRMTSLFAPLVDCLYVSDTDLEPVSLVIARIEYAANRSL